MRITSNYASIKMARKTTPAPKTPRPRLTKSKAEAETLIKEQISKLKNLLTNSTRVEQAQKELDQLTAYNKDLLATIFDNDFFEADYHNAELAGLSARHRAVRVSWLGGRGEPEEVVSKEKRFQQEVQGHIASLEGIVQRLELIPEPTEISNAQENKQAKPEFGSDIFIVHGRDNSTKDTVARFIEKLGLDAVILHEKPNAGKTLIEKFEKFSNVGFAIILMTPDDVGSLASNPKNLKPRSRQNVIFELGYFIGKIGRERVCALYAKDVELPSDYEGVAFIPMESDWRLSVAKEIKAAGIDIDMNKAIE